MSLYLHCTYTGKEGSSELVTDLHNMLNYHTGILNYSTPVLGEAML